MIPSLRKIKNFPKRKHQSGVIPARAGSSGKVEVYGGLTGRPDDVTLVSKLKSVKRGPKTRFWLYRRLKKMFGTHMKVGVEKKNARNSPNSQNYGIFCVFFG